MINQNTTYKVIARKTRDYLAGVITWQHLMDELYKADYERDPLISDLFDLIEHEPKRGGFGGVSESEWRQYQTEIADLVSKLECGGS